MQGGIVGKCDIKFKPATDTMPPAGPNDPRMIGMQNNMCTRDVKTGA